MLQAKLLCCGWNFFAVDETAELQTTELKTKLLCCNRNLIFCSRKRELRCTAERHESRNKRKTETEERT